LRGHLTVELSSALVSIPKGEGNTTRETGEEEFIRARQRKQEKAKNHE